MIRVKRDRKIDGKIVRPSDAWEEKAHAETILAINAKIHGIRYQFKASIYAAREVRSALEKLFHQKCAYCEWKSTRADWDVEHFRPKAGVREDPAHPGYYWLAYDWNNLYPSCQYCNQGRKDESAGVVLGKRDQFPLENCLTRAVNERSDLSLERRLLIDPCRDSPEKYITFGMDGRPVAIDNNPKGNKTIEIFHLDHPKTNGARMAIIEEYVFLHGALEFAYSLLKQDPKCSKAKEHIQQLEDKLRAMTLDPSLFAAVARTIKRNSAAFLPPR